MDPHLTSGGRAAGIAVSLYGVRSGRNWGCGDFRDLRSVIDWVAEELGASFVALNPLHAIHNRRPFNTSPYLPNCIFYQNFLYLDVEGMEDYRALPEGAGTARVGSGDAGDRGAARHAVCGIRAGERAEAALSEDSRSRSFCASGGTGGAGRARFEAFREREGDLLETFATYCALDEDLHGAIPTSGCGPTGRRRIRTPIPRRRRPSARSTGGA